MKATIFKYIDKEPFSKDSVSLYMGFTNKLFTPIKYGDRIAILLDKNVYSVYILNDGNNEVFVFSADVREIRRLLHSCKKESYVGTEDSTIQNLKDKLFRLVDTISHDAQHHFFKSKNAKHYNRILLNSNAKFYKTIKALSSGEISRAFRASINIAAEVKSIGEFKIRVTELNRKLKKYEELLHKYVDGLKSYNNVYRYAAYSGEGAC